MDKQTLTAIIEACEATGANLAGLKAAHGENKIKRWRRKYAVINNETGEKGVVDKANNTLKLSCVETVFTDLLSVHNNDGHRYPHSESDKALEKRFLEKVVNKYIKIPKRVVELFVATCPGCNIKMSREIMHSLEDQNRQLLEGTSSSNEVPIAGSADANVVAADNDVNEGNNSMAAATKTDSSDGSNEGGDKEKEGAEENEKSKNILMRQNGSEEKLGGKRGSEEEDGKEDEEDDEHSEDEREEEEDGKQRSTIVSGQKGVKESTSQKRARHAQPDTRPLFFITQTSPDVPMITPQNMSNLMEMLKKTIYGVLYKVGAFITTKSAFTFLMWRGITH